LVCRRQHRRETERYKVVADRSAGDQSTPPTSGPPTFVAARAGSYNQPSRREGDALGVEGLIVEVVRAEGLEPSSSFEHGHLKPACLPSFTTPARPAIVPLRSPLNLSAVAPNLG
jgi:hypothetical protein